MPNPLPLGLHPRSRLDNPVIVAAGRLVQEKQFRSWSPRSPRSPTRSPTGGCGSSATDRSDPSWSARSASGGCGTGSSCPAAPPTWPPSGRRRGRRADVPRRRVPAGRAGGHGRRGAGRQLRLCVGAARDHRARGERSARRPPLRGRHGGRAAPPGDRRRAPAAPRPGRAPHRRQYDADVLAERWVGDLLRGPGPSGRPGRLAAAAPRGGLDARARPASRPPRRRSSHPGAGPARCARLGGRAWPARSATTGSSSRPTTRRRRWWWCRCRRATRSCRAGGGRRAGVPLAARPGASAGRSDGDDRRARPRPAPRPDHRRVPRALAGRREAEPARPGLPGRRASSGRWRQRRPGRPRAATPTCPPPRGTGPSTSRSRGSRPGRCR